MGEKSRGNWGVSICIKCLENRCDKHTPPKDTLKKDIPPIDPLKETREITIPPSNPLE